MEEIINGEQLLENVEKSKDGAIMQENNVVAQTQTDSSPVKKFKDEKELEKAYVNLEREFTKKCQELKALKENSCDNNILPQDKILGEQKLNEFLEQNPVAKKFADELKKELGEDKVDDNSLEKALNKVKANHFKTNEELLEDKDFVENYVLTNSSITDRIVTNYLSNVVSNKITPLMSNFGGGSVMITPKTKPTSIKEAGDYMVALINNK